MFFLLLNSALTSILARRNQGPVYLDQNEFLNGFFRNKKTRQKIFVHTGKRKKCLSLKRRCVILVPRLLTMGSETSGLGKENADTLDCTLEHAHIRSRQHVFLPANNFNCCLKTLSFHISSTAIKTNSITCID